MLLSRFQDVKMESVWSSAAYDEIGVFPRSAAGTTRSAPRPERHRRLSRWRSSTPHGLAAVVRVTTYSGARLPGYLSKSASSSRTCPAR